MASQLGDWIFKWSAVQVSLLSGLPWSGTAPQRDEVIPLNKIQIRFFRENWWFHVEEMGFPFLEGSLFLKQSFLFVLPDKQLLSSRTWLILGFHLGFCPAITPRPLHMRSVFVHPKVPQFHIPDVADVSNLRLSFGALQGRQKIHRILIWEIPFMTKNWSARVWTKAAKSGNWMASARNSFKSTCVSSSGRHRSHQPPPEQEQNLARESQRASEHQQQHCLLKKNTTWQKRENFAAASTTAPTGTVRRPCRSAIIIIIIIIMYHVSSEFWTLSASSWATRMRTRQSSLHPIRDSSFPDVNFNFSLIAMAQTIA